MARVMKSPNMMSTTGRIPVIAAPTATPVMPASEMGESTTRSGPNSCTRPDSTLNGVPASATSSPTMNTRSSARISSARASFTAWANVSSRSAAAGSSVRTSLRVDVLVHLLSVRVGRGQRELHAGGHLLLGLPLQVLEGLPVRGTPLQDPVGHQPHGVAAGLPVLLLLLRPVVRPVHVADVVSEPPVGHALEEGGTVAAASPFDCLAGCGVHCADVLAVDDLGGDAERRGPSGDLARRGLGVGRVLVVEVVLADEDDRELPQRGHVHDLVQHALAEGPLAEEAHGDLAGAAHLRRQCRPRGDAGASRDDRVRAEVAGVRVGDVHGAALAPAVPGLLAQQLREHPVHLRPLGQAVAVPAMRAGDVVVAAEDRAHADRHRLLAHVEMGQARHLGPEVQLVDVQLEVADAEHGRVHLERVLGGELGASRRASGRRSNARFLRPIDALPLRGHWSTPDRCARTRNSTAKSSLSRPMARAEVSSSFTTAVVGSGTSNSRPDSRASSMSFCIMLTSNHASSGISSTNGPRYRTIGDAITLFSRTSTAFSRAIPPLSARSTPSLNAVIWTARLRFEAVFMRTACPVPPTWLTFGPMSSSTGRARSKASGSPPTMIERFPCSSVRTLPDTGASSIWAPRSATRLASSRLAAGLTVLRST